ncbi:FHA domain-containing protein At4g14490-like isoform X2 [Humulus lupulus]|uniref:FHA domain-containing protein At4g14490-like isoform X2 n=1 Tax=Humulus lupulus TaxID=3486 RepID=UPI002B40897E|nr:FHA domain-containing protein At4g14490-like isoform X2 [Humulus lupulus]
MALKLEITKGPRAGETLEYRPGSTIRIGRVVRGNNLTIKDSGISTKHLSLESESGKWLLQDLGSSNGSFLNDQLIDPDVPVDLSDGDCIKIGESTSISVKIEVHDGSYLRRSSRRGVQEKDGGASGATNRGRRGKVAKEKEKEVECALGVENAEAVDVVEVVEKPRRGRKPRVLKSVVEEKEKEKEEQEHEEKMGQLRQVRTRRTRSSKKEENAVSCSVLEKIPENSDVEGGQVKVGNKKTTRAGGGTRRRKNSPQKSPDCVEVIDLKDELIMREHECEKAVSELGVEEVCEKAVGELCVEEIGEKEDHGRDACGISGEAKKDSASGSKEKLGESGKELDLEKMTLGEWFDYLEIALPKQIIEASEEMIKGMRLKAERFHNYMVELEAPIVLSFKVAFCSMEIIFSSEITSQQISLSCE